MMIRSVLMMVLCVSLARNAEGRKWTDVTGTHTVEAEFVGVEGTNVRLRRANGMEVKVPILKLSAADRRYLRDRMAAKAGPKTGPGPVKAATTSRPKPTSNSKPLPANTIKKMLTRRATFSSTTLSLEQFARELEAQGQLTVFFDRRSLSGEGLRVEQQVRLSKQELQLTDALNEACGEDFLWAVRQDVVIIGPNAPHLYMSTRVYQCMGRVSAAQARRQIQAIAPDSWNAMGGPGVSALLGQRVVVVRHSPSIHRAIQAKMNNAVRLVRASKHTALHPIFDKLRLRAAWPAEEIPLDKLAARLAEQLKIKVSIQSHWKGDTAPVNIGLTTTCENALHLGLRQKELAWSIVRDELVLTTEDAAEEMMGTINIDIRALSKMAHPENIRSLIEETVEPHWWSNYGGPGDTRVLPNGFLNVTQSWETIWSIGELLDDLAAVGK